MKLVSYFHQLFFILILIACSTTAQEVEDEREFSYIEDSHVGPAHWGEIRPEWKICTSGWMQSPINIIDERVQPVSRSSPIPAYYKPSNATLKNRGHDIMLRWTDGAGLIRIDGTNYQLNQLHWHSPSEHAINGRKFDMEVHLVHQSKDNRTAVIGILYKIGRNDSFLSTITHDLETIVDHKKELEKVVGIVDPQFEIFGTKNYYQYIGSLTTPPCTQDIIWTILRKVRTVSKEQVKLIRDAIHDDSKVNARPLQPLRSRMVKLVTMAMKKAKVHAK